MGVDFVEADADAAGVETTEEEEGEASETVIRLDKIGENVFWFS